MPEKSSADNSDWQRQGLKAAHWALGVALDHMKQDTPAPAPPPAPVVSTEEPLTGLRAVVVFLLGSGAVIALVAGLLFGASQAPAPRLFTPAAPVLAESEQSRCTKISTTEVRGKDGALSRTEVHEDNVSCDGESAKQASAGGAARLVVPGLLGLSTLYDLL